MRLRACSRLWLPLILASCAHRPAPSPPPELPHTLAELERAEAQSPHDPRIKAELARRFWCAGERGIALEHWLWLTQFAGASNEGEQAHRYLRLARNKNFDQVKGELNCSL